MTKVKISICLSLLTTFSWCMFEDLTKMMKDLLRDYGIEETHQVRKHINKLSFEFMGTQKEKLSSNWIRSPFLHARSLLSYGLGILEDTHQEYLKEKFQLEGDKARPAAYGIKHIIEANWGKGIKTGSSGWLKSQTPYMEFYHYLNDKYAKVFLGHIDPENELNINEPIQWVQDTCPQLSLLSSEHLPEGPFYTLGVQHISIPWMYGAEENEDITFSNQKTDVTVPSIKIPTPINIKKTDTTTIWASPLPQEENDDPLIFIGVMPDNDLSMKDILEKLNVEYVEDLFSKLQEVETEVVDLILPQFCFEDLLKHTTEEDFFELKMISPDLLPQKGQVLHQVKIEMGPQLSSSSLSLDAPKEKLIVNRPFLWFVYAPKLEFILAYGTCYDPSIKKCELLSNQNS